ncbi:MAG: class I SAM-dependent methyltransferase [Candidatus Omnitrophota bacterium]
MGGEKTFYKRYWEDEHIKINPFDCHPGKWIEGNFKFHLDFFKSFINGKILDFGCGRGDFTSMISKYCDSICGIDCSQAAIDSAKDIYPEIDFQVLGESSKFPYADESFDAIFMIDVLEHILDTETLLEETNRVLKSNGHLLIATSQLTRLKLFIIALLSLDKYFYPTTPHIRYFTKNNLSGLLRQKGFEVIRYKKNRTYFGFIPQGQMVVVSKIDKK